MEKCTQNDLECRLKKLEARNFMVVFSFISTLVLLSFLVMGQEKLKKSYEAESFTLIDASGKEIGKFGPDGEGSVGLFLYDKNGNVGASLTVQNKKYGLVLKDKNGNSRIELAIKNDEDVYLNMIDDNKVKRVGISVTNKDGARYDLFDEKDRCASFCLKESGQPFLSMNNNDGKNGLSLYLNKDKPSKESQGLMFWENDIKRIEIEHIKNGHSGIYLNNPITKIKSSFMNGEDGWSGLSFEGQKDGASIEFGFMPNDWVGFAIREDSIQRAACFLRPDKTINFIISDNNKENRLRIIGEQNNMPILKFFDKDGKVVHKIP